MEKRKELSKLIAQFKTAMLVTRDHDGGDGAPAGSRLRARPMAIADVEDTSLLRFVSSIDSDKVDELVVDPRVMVTMQSSSAYITIDGTATISKERSKLQRVWGPALDAWFEEGVDDPRATLIEVRGESAEFWEMNAPSKLRYLFEVAKASLGDTSVNPDAAGKHGQVDL